ncbi:benzoate/H(+) symporter BenE family transporter [Fundidesulfovibrio soli]|uniref:benzoate/H(+) symporter BenE family transporter n=1 Tax=Fundidesulfovibrio soli TaxID=2922716 RepID=UPI001FAF969E|nr:benzoate/H(+) symporter BenE family transporter [Fundidesulfovibrio soli]
MSTAVYTPTASRSVFKDASLSAITAGLVAVAVSFGGPAAIIFQAASAANLSPAQLSSWIWAICIGSGVTGVWLSLRYRDPVVTAWSTPGVALLATGWAAYPYPEAIGAFVVAGALITAAGASGVFQTMMDRIPRPLVSAMLAGILLRFGVDVFGYLAKAPLLAGVMVAAYLAAKRLTPRYAIVCTLLSGFAAAWAQGALDFSTVHATLATPVFTPPVFSLGAVVGLGLPLFLVTMTGQNATGLGVMRASGYHTPGNPLVWVTGLASTLLAPFGCHGVNLAAITAAICTGPESHPDPARRYVAAVVCGLCYLVVGVFGAALVGLFTALPGALIAVVSGLALFGAIASGLSQAMEDATRREAALVTLLLTISGVSFFGIGSAFWGLIGGLLADRVLTRTHA